MNNLNINTNTSEKREIIPIFFAVDKNYIPYLTVAIISLIDNASIDYDYKMYVLVDKIDKADKDKVKSLEREHFEIEFINVSKQLSKIKNRLHIRDYYTNATYYRFFIPEMFPQYKKGIYLDCDIAVCEDISKMYKIDLGDNFLGASPDELVGSIEVFSEYSEKYLSIPQKQYFSAGILLMNLEKMRNENIIGTFLKLMKWRTFRVAQDQDYLNVICHDKVVYLDKRWNLTPFPDVDKTQKPFIVHYKVIWRPWHYKGVSFEEYFWKYADMSPYKAEIYDCLENFDDAKKANDGVQYEHLVSLAMEDIASVVIDETVSPLDFLVTLFEDN